MLRSQGCSVRSLGRSVLSDRIGFYISDMANATRTRRENTVDFVNTMNITDTKYADSRNNRARPVLAHARVKPLAHCDKNDFDSGDRVPSNVVAPGRLQLGSSRKLRAGGH